MCVIGEIESQLSRNAIGNLKRLVNSGVARGSQLSGNLINSTNIFYI